jgi:hypothetical protein
MFINYTIRNTTLLVSFEIPITGRIENWKDVLDLSRFCAAPSARLGHFSFEGDGSFPAQC